MGKNLDDQSAKVLIKKPSGICMFERSKGGHIYEKELTYQNSHMLSSLIVKEKAKDSDNGIYMRLEGF